MSLEKIPGNFSKQLNLKSKMHKRTLCYYHFHTICLLNEPKIEMNRKNSFTMSKENPCLRILYTYLNFKLINFNMVFSSPVEMNGENLCTSLGGAVGFSKMLKFNVICFMCG